MERAAPRWSTSEHETDAGAVESRQWITLPRALVPADDGGARELGRRYLAEVGPVLARPRASETAGGRRRPRPRGDRAPASLRPSRGPRRGRPGRVPVCDSRRSPRRPSGRIARRRAAPGGRARAGRRRLLPPARREHAETVAPPSPLHRDPGARAPSRRPSVPRTRGRRVDLVRARRLRSVGSYRSGAPAGARPPTRRRGGLPPAVGRPQKAWCGRVPTSPTPIRSPGSSGEDDVLVYLVHSLGTADFEEVDRLAADTVAAAAAQARARQIVYLGGLGDAAETASAHLRSRAETGRAAGGGPGARHDAACRNGGRPGKRRLRDDPGARRPAAGDDLPSLGLDSHPADRASGRRRSTSRPSAGWRRPTASRSTSAAPRS